MEYTWEKVMENERILTIVKGEEFILNIKDEIENKDIFYDQYCMAADILEDIIVSGDKNHLPNDYIIETENNIIAFCGERGEGKSSAMMTFTNSLYKSQNSKKDNFFKNYEIIKKVHFLKPIIIDPSLFDNVHNVLDIILASLYKKFRDEYEKDNERNGRDYEREHLLYQFQKVYKSVSLLNNPTEMLQNEFDGEGNIENLSKLGESTRLKLDLQKLIQLYLDFMIEETIPKKLLIAVDDLDLCNSNAYKMAEQIRKYLIIPNVVIVMAIKIEQLQMCVQEENYKNYGNIMRTGEKTPTFYEDVRNMSERYIAKLLPKARRIYLPNVQRMNHTKIKYINREGTAVSEDKIADSVSNSLLDLIFQKTGMRFLINSENNSFLLPDNLRDTVNVITLLRDMKDPDSDSDYYSNIRKFVDYYEKEWLPQNLNADDYRELRELTYAPYLQLHTEIQHELSKKYEVTDKKYVWGMANYTTERVNCYLWSINWMLYYENNVYDKKLKRFAYVFHVLYTIRLGELRRSQDYAELARFIGGYIWGENFNNVIPNVSILSGAFNRSRFTMPTVMVYNSIGKFLGFKMSELLKSNISKISEDDDKKQKMIVWLLTGLLANTFQNENAGNSKIPSQMMYTYEFVPIISSNYVILNFVQLCLENYIIGMCSLNSIYDKVNMELLGITREEFGQMVDNIEKSNQEIVEAFRTIITNVDLSLTFAEYCRDKKGTKEGGIKTERDRTKTAVDRFFRNAELFYREYVDDKNNIRFNTLLINVDEGRSITINISKLYADLMQEYIESSLLIKETKKAEELNKLDRDLKNNHSFDLEVQKVSQYLITKTAENAKRQMDNLVRNIKYYYSDHTGEIIEDLDVGPLRMFYSELLDLYLEDPKTILPERLCEEYKSIMKLYKRFNEEE